MTTHIRITTETHTDISSHITYATIRPSKHTWHTVELDRHTIGAYDNTDTAAEAKSITAATIEHYCIGNATWHDNHTASAEPKPVTKALMSMKMTEQDDLTKRGQTIIEQIRAERAMRQARIQGARQVRSSKLGLLTDPKRSIFA